MLRPSFIGLLGGRWPGRGDLDWGDTCDQPEVRQIVGHDGRAEFPGGRSQQEIVAKAPLPQAAGIAAKPTQVPIELGGELPRRERRDVDSAPDTEGLDEALNLAVMAWGLGSNKKLVDHDRTEHELRQSGSMEGPERGRIRTPGKRLNVEIAVEEEHRLVCGGEVIHKPTLADQAVQAGVDLSAEQGEVVNGIQGAGNRLGFGGRSQHFLGTIDLGLIENQVLAPERGLLGTGRHGRPPCHLYPSACDLYPQRGHLFNAFADQYFACWPRVPTRNSVRRFALRPLCHPERSEGSLRDRHPAP